MGRLSVNSAGRVHYGVKPGQDDVFYQIDSSRFRLYDPKNDPPPIYAVDGESQCKERPEEDIELPQSTEFAYEKDLRNYLAKNLGVIEPGLSLYEEEEIKPAFPI